MTFALATAALVSMLARTRLSGASGALGAEAERLALVIGCLTLLAFLPANCRFALVSGAIMKRPFALPGLSSNAQREGMEAASRQSVVANGGE